MKPSDALQAVPAGLRDPLLLEYAEILKNFAEHRWGPSELSAGKFCEIVYTILLGHASGTYAASPSKPGNFVGACRQLENNGHVPRSFQILIPRMLPALYEVRNNRGVGHVGGDVDPNHMDATAVASMCNWIMAELVRVYHSLSTQEAQTLVDQLADRQVPIIWEHGDVKRILKPKMPILEQILIFLSTSTGAVALVDLMRWCDYTNSTYFKKTITKLDAERLVFFDKATKSAQILPPGVTRAAKLIAAWDPKL